MFISRLTSQLRLNHQEVFPGDLIRSQLLDCGIEMSSRYVEFHLIEARELQFESRDDRRNRVIARKGRCAFNQEMFLNL